MQELFPKIKTMFKPAFDPYQSIIVQNVIKVKSFTFCYEIAQRLQKKRVPPNGYIAKLKQSLSEEEWNMLKRLHKQKKDKEVKKCQSLPISPIIEPDKSRAPEIITESS